MIPAWILIILQIIGAIPTIIKIIAAIIDMIRKLPTSAEREDAKLRLKNILQRVKKNRTVSAEDLSELHKLQCDLENRSGACKPE